MTKSTTCVEINGLGFNRRLHCEPFFQTLSLLIVINLALNKATVQSSKLVDENGYAYSSSLAGDGVRDNHPASCAITDEERDEGWWKVTLSTTELYFINNVTIYNRMDCCSKKQSDAKVYVLKDGDKKSCGDLDDMEDVQMEAVVCDEIGNEVLLRSDMEDAHFMLCEVEVYGYKYDES